MSTSLSIHHGQKAEFTAKTPRAQSEECKGDNEMDETNGMKKETGATSR